MHPFMDGHQSAFRVIIYMALTLHLLSIYQLYILSYVLLLEMDYCYLAYLRWIFVVWIGS